MTIRTTFRTERDLRAYDLENEAGEKVSLEETADGTLAFRRGEQPFDLSPDFLRALSPLLVHFTRYGNLPLPEAPKD